jgi:hypothetical protein
MKPDDLESIKHGIGCILIVLAAAIILYMTKLSQITNLLEQLLRKTHG